MNSWVIELSINPRETPASNCAFLVAILPCTETATVPFKLTSKSETFIQSGEERPDNIYTAFVTG